MRKIFFTVFFGILFVGLLIPGQYAVANLSEDDYINIKLTSPIRSKNIVKLHNEDGFALYNKDDTLNEIEFIEDENINIKLGNQNQIDILDMDNEVVLSFNQEDIIITSRNDYDRKIKVEDKYYRDYINFKIEGNELSVINYIELDNYLYGVVPREMPASFPMDALKAQAIAARSYALKTMNKHINEGYNLCDTTHCQVYGGLDGEDDRTNKAVDETKGMIITYDGNIIDAVYHSNSGGYTENAIEAWGGSSPYLIAVKDEFSYGSPNSDWSFTMTTDQINSKLQDNGINIGEIIDMEIVETSPSGRVSKLKVVGTSGEDILNKSKIRQVLGSTELKSTWFTIKRDDNVEISETVYVIDGENINPQTIDINKSYILDGNLNKSPSRGIKSRVVTRHNITQIMGNTSNTDSFIIDGKGYGHGVGMSQWGAKGMAELGYTFEEILKHYYTGVEITY